MEKISDFFRELIYIPESLLIVVGALIAVIAGSGGVPYVPVQGNAQWILGAFGGVLAAAGVWLVIQAGLRPYGVQILSPPPNSPVASAVAVTGTVRHIPNGKELWLVRVYDDETYYPVKKVSVGRGERTWHEQFDFRAADKIGAFIFGKEGLALISYYKDAEKRHNQWMDKFDVPKDAKERYLPNPKLQSIKALRIKVCHIVKVTRTGY